MLTGAFVAAVVASLTQNAYLGLIRQAQRGFDMDYCVQLAFDNINAPETEGYGVDHVSVVEGVGSYGNCFGVPNVGGSLLTASGLAFIGASTNGYFRAYDVQSGERLWERYMGAGVQSTPMTYRLKPEGKQYVVVAAGGHKYLGSKLGDSIVAFALKD